MSSVELHIHTLSVLSIWVCQYLQ